MCISICRVVNHYLMIGDCRWLWAKGICSNQTLRHDLFLIDELTSSTVLTMPMFNRKLWSFLYFFLVFISCCFYSLVMGWLSYMDNDRKVDCMKYSCTVSQGILCSFFNFISTSEMNSICFLTGPYNSSSYTSYPR